MEEAFVGHGEHDAVERVFGFDGAAINDGCRPAVIGSPMARRASVMEPLPLESSTSAPRSQSISVTRPGPPWRRVPARGRYRRICGHNRIGGRGHRRTRSDVGIDIAGGGHRQL